MRKNIVAGNWKMNLKRDEGLDLINDVINLLPSDNKVEVVFAPSFIHLYKVNKMCLNLDKVNTASQNVSKEERGAFTGEISAEIIRSANVKYTIIGHSERREYFKETNEDLKQKVDVSLENNLEVIFCCGESLDQREEEVHFNWLKIQISESLFHLSSDDFRKIIIAYEPIWAIGTGVTASSDQAEEIHKFIREIIAQKYGDELANNISILYGGSCKPTNARDIFSKDNIDGGLIGGASLNAESFVEIIKSF
ncbi:MAG: triose-phosphate isomerase [Flavobacteriales bacterium]|jgi:triosephosphate isomerase|nr:triose-phosphate isomerase [Flavobacteriales bacterium]